MAKTKTYIQEDMNAAAAVIAITYLNEFRNNFAMEMPRAADFAFRSDKTKPIYVLNNTGNEFKLLADMLSDCQSECIKKAVKILNEIALELNKKNTQNIFDLENSISDVMELIGQYNLGERGELGSTIIRNKFSEAQKNRMNEPGYKGPRSIKKHGKETITYRYHS